MNRSSVQGSPTEWVPDAYQSNEDSSVHAPLNGKVVEDWRFHGDSRSSPGTLRLMLSQSAQNHLSPSKPHQRTGDNGIMNGAMKLEHFSSPDSLKSNLCHPGSALSVSGQSRNRRGYAISLRTSMLFCFVSVFIFIGMLGSRGPGYNLRLVPTLEMYRSYRRLQAEVVVDPFKGGIFSQGTVRMRELPACKGFEEDSVPCYKALGNLGSGDVLGEGEGRHCEASGRREQCLIQLPDEYKTPLRWPESKDGVWRGNMKFSEQFGLSGRRMARLKLGDDDFVTVNLGEPDLDGLENHVQQITKAMGADDASQLRTVLDINCGLSRLGGHHQLLEKPSILCLAPYEVIGSQVQFALERGFPAMIGSLINTQLPFPSSSFDTIHCFDCNFDWTWKEGLLLLELDRLLKPGGFFIWTFQVAMPVEPLMKMHEQDWETNKELASKICWTALSEADQIVVWKKTANHSCYSSRGLKAGPKLCDRLEVDANSTWYPPLRPCIAGPTVDKGIQLRQRQQHHGPVNGFSTEELSDDSHVWSATVKSYWSLLTPLIFSDHPKRPGEEDPLPPSNIVRNIMDMNAGYGSLNAALLEAKKSVWVMNVVPRSGPDTLSTIYNRGLVGALHDWCEAFPTYPRTYDLLHGIGLLSQEAARPSGCGLSNLFLEMDRILRPEGWVILRDKVELIEDVRIAAGQMRWDSRVIEVEGLEDQQLLVCQKTFWKSQSSKVLL